MKGIRINSTLAQAIWQTVRDRDSRVWYSGGWIWIYGSGHITRLQNVGVDLGVKRFNINKNVFKRVFKDYYVIISPTAGGIYDSEDNCVKVYDCLEQLAAYKWEQYMNPGTAKTIGYSFVDLRGLAAAANILQAAVPERQCGATCECIEDTHNIIRLLTQNDEWKVEGIVFDDDSLNPKRSIRWHD